MAKFRVCLWEKVKYVTIVDAKDEDEACEAAKEIWADSATNPATGELDGFEETGEGIFASDAWLADEDASQEELI